MVACGKPVGPWGRAGYRDCGPTGCAGDIADVGNVSTQAAEDRESPAACGRFAMNRAVSKVGDQQAPVCCEPDTGVLFGRRQRERRDLSRVSVNLTNRLPVDVCYID